MKTLFLTFGFTLLSVVLFSQTVLKFETHGYGNQFSNLMLTTQNVEIGEKGENVTWDFSHVSMKNDFVANFADPKSKNDGLIFPKANIKLEEFENQFFFEANERESKQVGYISKEGNVIKYSEPFVKMKYPFGYGDTFSGKYAGECLKDGKSVGPINGRYSVTADAYGTLILPGALTYSNALRINETQTYIQYINDEKYEITHEAFRWYVQEHRFPVFVVVQSQWKYPNGKVHNATRTVYNPVVIYHGSDALAITSTQLERKLSVFPNPILNDFSVRVFTDSPKDVLLQIFDIKGNLIHMIDHLKNLEGEMLFSVSAKNLGMESGIYLVKVNSANDEFVERIVVQ
ncbi:MAG: T9SS type A sorting domain-containing protein [Salinivirgaceae bacterium]|nr:T9SS type A sorting domain-containing protein [Salinivirgaceae bacterium]